MPISDQEIERRRYYLEWAAGERMEMTYRPDNFHLRHPFLYGWFSFTFVCFVSVIGFFLIPLGPLAGVWVAVRQPGYVKRGAQLEWRAYKVHRKADRARRRAAARAIDRAGGAAIRR